MDHRYVYTSSLNSFAGHAASFTRCNTIMLFISAGVYLSANNCCLIYGNQRNPAPVI